ncbi:hypothetical protein [Streptomyces sp. KR80]|uniref:hypothetical protein n=1 Tax=Streptomyces sp. KR80 TaxID=3457426 RepID=UPI003FD3F317
MSYPIPATYRRARLWGRLAVTLACAGAVTFSALPGLPGLQGEANAAIKGGKRCDKKYGLPTNPSGGRKPGDFPHDYVRPDTEQDVMEFTNDRRAMDGLNLPGNPADYLDKVGKDPDKYEEGDPKRVFASYKRYLGNKPPGTNDQFRDWLVNDYIDMAERRTRGGAFERKVVTDFKLTGPDWLCQVTVEIPDPDKPDGKPPIRRIYDAYNQRTKQFLEFKAGGAHDDRQIPKDRKILNHKDYARHNLRYVLGGDQEPDTRNKLGKLNKDVGGNDLQRRVSVYEHRTTPREQWRPSVYSSKDTYMNARPQPGANPGTKVIDRSAPNPETARRQMERAQQRNATGSGVRGPGGVDFTTLDLRYVGEPVKGKGLDYAFSAKKTDPNVNPGYGGKEKAQLISDSFFTWLALTPEKFWVNLNPDQPDKIMDAKFGKTDAGRILLEADLQMKHDFYKTMDPKTNRGKLFWDSLARRNGTPCLHGIRNWIEPEPAKVREQDGGIYILDAPMKLNSVPQETNTPGPGGHGCDLTKAEIDHNQRMVETMIVPEVKKQINTAPQYADLRRVYTSRVAAEWIRQQDAKKPTDFHKIINSNNVSRWPLRGKNKNWDKSDLFQRYVKIFREGEFKYELEYGGTVYTYMVGGVDFSKSPKRNISRTQFTLQHRNLPKSTKTGVQAMTNDLDDDKRLLLGGNTAYKGGGGGGGGQPDPTPTPTDPEDPKPTDTPSTPAPDPSTPADGGDKPTPPANKPDPDGDLADTGSDTPIGLIAGIAAALAAAGTALMWWMRRRKTAQS